MMSVLKRWFEAAARRDLDEITALAEEIIAEDHVAHFAGSEMRGRVALVEHLTASSSAFSGSRVVWEDMVAEGDRIASRTTWSLTHTGEFMGIPATGKTVTIPVLYVHRISDGKIREAWMDWDSLHTLLNELKGG
jgi:steroid delta-isomerase-like uncharacterized protein